ncbi:flippase-like domain-containing protein [archaeon]|nr:flippase-like domain-containing protein [archaeon]
MNKNLILRSFVTLILIIIILLIIDINKLIDNLKNSNIIYLFLALLLTIPFVLLKSFKWFLLIRGFVGKFNFTRVLKSFLVGMCFGLITPGRIGEIARVYYFKKNKAKIGFLVGIDKLLDLFVVVIYSLIGIILLFNIKLLITVVILAFLIIFLIYNPNIIIRIFKFLFKILKSKKMIDLFSSVKLPKKNKIISLTLFITFLTYIIPLIQFYLILIGLKVNISFSDVIFVQPLIMLTNILPLTISGLGVREGLSAILLSFFNIPKEVAINASFLLFIVTTFVIGIIGLYFILNKKI